MEDKGGQLSTIKGSIIQEHSKFQTHMSLIKDKLKEKKKPTTVDKSHTTQSNCFLCSKGNYQKAESQPVRRVGCVRIS